MYDVSQEEFIKRRERVLKALGPDGVAVIFGEPERTRSNDTEFKYRPGSDILYLSGFREPGTVLVFAPGHEAGDFVMFVRGRNPDAETWTGRRVGVDGVKARFGADEAHDIDTLWEKLPDYVRGRKALYWAMGEDPTTDTNILKMCKTLRATRRKAPESPTSFGDVRDIVHEMRLFKSPVELDLMRRAAAITSEAHTIGMRHTRPGIFEYEVETAIENHFRQHGCEGPAYTSIVGGGDNATILHYTENRSELKAGDVLLIDAGCEHHYYAADITRSFPVSGKFSPVQRDVYTAVLEAEVAAIALVRKGVRYDTLQEETVKRLTQAMVDLGALKGSVDELIENESYRKYYPHNVGHWLGIDVHDVGNYFGEDKNYRKLEAGMVLTIEPGLYFPAHDMELPEALRGIGIRIEDDVLVTDAEPEVLTAACPKNIDEVEDLVGQQ